MSYYSGSLYQDVGRNWKGYCFAYLMLLLSLCLIPETFKIHAALSDFIDSEAPKFVSQTPTITISKGKASVPLKAPYFINYPDKTGPFAVIDTTGRFTSLDTTTATMLLTGTKLFIRKGPAEIRSFDLSPVDDLVIDQKLIYSWIRIIRDWSVFVFYPFVLFFTFLLQVVQVFMCALSGTLFAKRFKVDLNYQALVRLAAVSFTPAVVLQAAHSLLDIDFPHSSFISFLIATGYLYYAVGMVSEEENEINHRNTEKG